ncbi:hypothetical protein NMY22_g14666 [Coprinellus aureogranulatus]|nr:hypothetical protein NMY22_g14666 [Coprinellus aureogranulatus]
MELCLKAMPYRPNYDDGDAFDEMMVAEWWRADLDYASMLPSCHRPQPVYGLPRHSPTIYLGAGTDSRGSSPKVQVLKTVELLDLIIVCLKIAAVDSCGREAPARWKFKLRHLLTVNRAFFRATADMIWEDMNSLSPFIALLGPSGSNTVTEFRHGISTEKWERFKIYASRTRAISVLNDPTAPVMPACWAMSIESSPFRPTPMFPRLREMTLASPHPLALAIAVSSFKTLECLSMITNVSQNYGDMVQLMSAIIATFPTAGTGLSSLSITHQVDEAVMGNISRFSSLRSLAIDISPCDMPHLLSFANLQLETLNLNITPSNMTSFNSALLTTPTFNLMLARRSLPTLRRLTIVAICTHHIQLASFLSPRSLNHLELAFLYQGTPAQSVEASAFIIAAHLARNPGLTSLVAVGVSGSMHGVSQYPPASVNTPDWAPEFLSRLSSSTSLETVDVDNVQFRSPDIVIKTFRQLRSLRKLKSFRFFPCIAPSDGGPCVVPSLEDLRGVVDDNPLLGFLGLPINFDTIPVPPSLFSSHPLQVLTVVPHLNFQISSLPLHSLLQLANFLHVLFPSLRSVAHRSDVGSAQPYEWQSVAVILDAYRQVYGRATRHSQQ